MVEESENTIGVNILDGDAKVAVRKLSFPLMVSLVIGSLYYIVDAMYDFDKAEEFIKEYLQEEYSEKTRFHYMAYVAIIAYYWFVWAIYRELCGANIGEALINWRKMAEVYSDYLLNN